MCLPDYYYGFYLLNLYHKCCWCELSVCHVSPFSCEKRIFSYQYYSATISIIILIVPLMKPNNDFYGFCDWNPCCLGDRFDFDRRMCCLHYCGYRRKYDLYGHLHRYRGCPKLFVFLRLQRLLAYLRNTAHQNTRALTKSLQISLHTEKTKIVPQILRMKKKKKKKIPIH